MIDDEQEQTGNSLLNLFASPDDSRRGVFGLICGLSAEEQFMDSALELFVGLNKKQRALYGNWSLALFLDPQNEPIQLLPGLLNPWPINKNIWPAKTKMMHAKVALLGFGESINGMPDYYRLIVSTGNWTKESVNNSINLVWYCNYDTKSELKQKQESKDINEAVKFWEILLGINNQTKGYYAINGIIKQRIKDFLDNITDTTVTPKTGYYSQFISNLEYSVSEVGDNYFVPNSVGAQVIKRINKSRIRKNFIICGSGFFEQANFRKSKRKIIYQEPEVIHNIIKLLKDGVLSRNPTQWLVINPQTSGAAGLWIKNNDLDDTNWTICCPKHPSYTKAACSFHAKYIFVANHNNKDSISNGILYMGSANLSKQGFVLGPETGGNIEAGVIIKTDRYKNTDILCTNLGIHPNNELDPDEIPENPDSEEFENEDKEFKIHPPITYCIWDPNKLKLSFQWIDFTWKVVKLHGKIIKPPDETEISFNINDLDSNLRVKLCAQQASKWHDWFIPVFYENNKFYSAPTRYKHAYEIIDTIDCFPIILSEDEDDEYVDDYKKDLTAAGDIIINNKNYNELRDEYNSFPLHLATTLVEVIAIRNQYITEGQLPDWIEHLRRTLIYEMPDEIKKQLSALGVNFLYPLIKTPGFAPRNLNSKYKNVIKEIYDNWCLEK